MSLIEQKRVYWVWADMVARCNNPTHKQYMDYGGRGISVSTDWLSSVNFMRDMLPRPNGYTLERINNAAGYSKENCKWVTRIENNKNKRVYKCSPFGISGIERRGKGFRCRLRHAGRIVFDAQVGDFFEACCQRKAAEMIYVVAYLSREI
jgi:hypothetical protein